MGFFDFLGYGSGDPSNLDRSSLRGLGSEEAGFGEDGMVAYGQDRAQMPSVYAGLNRSNAGIDQTSQNMGQTQDYMRGQMTGQNSVSAEQLRQGLQQQQASQMSMAAGANRSNSAMAARTAAMQNARAGYGMAGQQAVAGLQERNQAATQLGQMQQAQGQLQLGQGNLRLGQGNLQLGQSGQDLQLGLGSLGLANGAYGQTLAHPQKSWGSAIGGALGGIAGAIGGLGLFGGGGDSTADPNGNPSGGGPVTDPSQVPDGGGPNTPSGTGDPSLPGDDNGWGP